MIQLDDKSLRTLQLIELELLQEVDRILPKMRDPLQHYCRHSSRGGASRRIHPLGR